MLSPGKYLVVVKFRNVVQVEPTDQIEKEEDLIEKIIGEGTTAVNWSVELLERSYDPNDPGR